MFPDCKNLKGCQYPASKSPTDWFVLGDILLRKADIAVAGMIRNFDREQVVDFTAPYMDYGVGILIRKPSAEINIFSFLGNHSELISEPNNLIGEKQVLSQSETENHAHPQRILGIQLLHLYSCFEKRVVFPGEDCFFS